MGKGGGGGGVVGVRKGLPKRKERGKRRTHDNDFFFRTEEREMGGDRSQNSTKRQGVEDLSEPSG